MGEGTVPPGTSDGSSGSSGSGSTPPMPPPPPPTCKYTCIAKLPLLCEELTDEKQCSARSDCDWGALACPMMCAPGGDCPPCPATCTTKVPPVCQSLADEKSCLQRSDCEWNQGPCPGMPCMPGGPCPPCPSSCEPKNPLPPPCPVIQAPPPGFCTGGTIVPKYNAAGCVVGYDCKQGYVTCTKLNQDYVAAVKAAKTCNPLSMSPVIQCSAQVEDQLFCPCTTFVNPGSAAFQKLVDLKKQWLAQSCDQQEIACPAIACMAPGSASCLGNTAAGTCVDDPN